MDLNFTAGRLLAGAIIALSVWIVHGFIEALLAAGVTAIATWPLYAAFRARLPRGVSKIGGVAIFTTAITVFVLAPMVFAFCALISEVHTVVQALASADSKGLALPVWLVDTPVFGPWLDARWQQEISRPGSLLMLTQHTDPSAMLQWAHSLGQFAFRHVLIVTFAVLLLGFFYQEGGSLARELTGALSQAIGERAEHYVEVGTRAVRAAVNSMLVVALFDGLVTALAFAAVGVPRPLTWAGITGALAAVPFLGYAAVAAMALQLALQGDPATAMLVLMLGSAVLLIGDKLIRPMAARGGMRLPFVWVLMGCIGGFSVLGLAGLVIGPVVLSLAREIGEQRGRETDV